MIFEQNADHFDDPRKLANMPYGDSNIGEYGKSYYEAAELVHGEFQQNLRRPTPPWIRTRIRATVNMWDLYMARMSVGDYGRFTDPATPTYFNSSSIIKSPQNPADICSDEIVVIDVRDISNDEAKREIIEYINILKDDGVSNLSIGEIARDLELDLDIVIEVFEESGLLS